MPAKSKSQQRLMGMVHDCQKNGNCASDKIQKIADSIKSSDATDFAETKHKNLPKKVVKESTTFREYILKEQQLNELKDEAEMHEVENHLSQMFRDVGVNRVVFTRHGGVDRVLGRNEDVTAQELSELFFKFKKLHKPKIDAEIEKRGRFQAVIKDYSSQINVVVDFTKQDSEMRIVTLERKPPNNFKGDRWPDFLQLKVW